MREIIVQSNKNIYETIEQIKSNTEEYKAIYFVRPQKWISRIKGRELMIGRYYYFTGVVSYLYGEVLPNQMGCVIKGRLKMSKAHKSILCLVLAVIWGFTIYAVLAEYECENLVNFKNILVTNHFLHISLFLTIAGILWSRVVKSKMLEDEVAEFLKDILS